MTTFHLLHSLEPILSAVGRLYVLGGEIFTVTTLLWGLKIAAGLVETTYNAGIVTGRFYFKHLHRWVKLAAKHLLVAAITILQLAWESAKKVYLNRQEILEALNGYRNAVGLCFVYRGLDHPVRQADRPQRLLPPAKAIIHPIIHPAFQLAEELQQKTCKEIRELTGIRRKCSKAQLIELAIAQ